jgi:hypothetical protein
MLAVSLVAAAVLAGGPPGAEEVGPFVRALWLVQRHGTAGALELSADRRVKAALAKAVAGDGIITREEVEGS